MRLGSLDIGERRGPYFAFGSAGVLKLLYGSPVSIFEKLYAAVLYESGDAFVSQPDFHHSGTAGIIAETKIGVLFLGGAYGEQGSGRFFFSLGRIL